MTENEKYSKKNCKHNYVVLKQEERWIYNFHEMDLTLYCTRCGRVKEDTIGLREA